jgi:sulfur-carrier protein
MLPQAYVETVPTVTLYLPEPLRTYGGGVAELPLCANTVQAVLDDLERTRPALYRNVCDETGAVRRHLNIFVNADHVRDLAGLDTTLRPGDVVTIVPAVSGG